MKDWKEALAAAKAKLLEEKYEPQVVDREIGFASQILSGNSYLAGMPAGSIYNSVVNVLRCGTTLSPASAEAYLVPRMKECRLDFGYRYFVRLCVQSGAIKGLHPFLVYADEEFEYSEAERRVLKHVPVYPESEEQQKGRKLTGIVTVATYPDNTKDAAFMPAWKAKKRRSISSSKDEGKAPWKNWEEEMWMKTGIKPHCKQLMYLVPASHSDKLQRAIEIADEIEMAEREAEQAKAEMPTSPIVTQKTEIQPAEGFDGLPF